MRKDEFVGFLTNALDEMVNNKGYEQANFDNVFSSDEGSCDDYSEEDDYPDEDDYYDDSYSETGDYNSSNSIFNQTHTFERQKADSVSDNFTSDLFTKLLEKFGASKEVKERVFNTRQSYEDIPNEVNTVCFGGTSNNFKMSYTRYEKPLEIPEDVFVNSDGDLESTLKSFDSVLSYVMNEVERIYGGKDRITDIAVFSDVVIINRVSFEPLLKDSLIKSLPYDLQYSVRNGCFAYLFDFSYLKDYKNLMSFSVDDVNFLFTKVRLDLGKNRDFEPRDMFGICKQLNVIRVGQYEITRQNKNEHADVFKTCRRSTEIADKLEDLGFKGMKSTWGCAKDIFFDKDSRLLWKSLKLVAVAGTATTVTAATLGFKLTRTVGKAGKSVFKGIGNIIDAVKDNS